MRSKQEMFILTSEFFEVKDIKLGLINPIEDTVKIQHSPFFGASSIILPFLVIMIQGPIVSNVIEHRSQ